MAMYTFEPTVRASAHCQPGIQVYVLMSDNKINVWQRLLQAAVKVKDSNRLGNWKTNTRLVHSQKKNLQKKDIQALSIS